MTRAAETVDALHAAGHRAETLDLPSSGPTADSLGDLHADVEAVTAALHDLDDDVVLVGHSGGEMVLTELGDHPRVRRSDLPVRGEGPVSGGVAGRSRHPHELRGAQLHGRRRRRAHPARTSSSAGCSPSPS